jgi:hypothetical protein
MKPEYLITEQKQGKRKIKEHSYQLETYISQITCLDLFLSFFIYFHSEHV